MLTCPLCIFVAQLTSSVTWQIKSDVNFNLNKSSTLHLLPQFFPNQTLNLLNIKKTSNFVASMASFRNNTCHSHLRSFNSQSCSSNLDPYLFINIQILPKHAQNILIPPKQIQNKPKIDWDIQNRS